MAVIEAKCSFALQEVIFESLLIEIKFRTDICYVMFLFYLCVVMQIKCLYDFFFIYYFVAYITHHVWIDEISPITSILLSIKYFWNSFERNSLPWSKLKVFMYFSSWFSHSTLNSFELVIGFRLMCHDIHIFISYVIVMIVTKYSYPPLAWTFTELHTSKCISPKHLWLFHL